MTGQAWGRAMNHIDCRKELILKLYGTVCSAAFLCTDWGTEGHSFPRGFCTAFGPKAFVAQSWVMKLMTSLEWKFNAEIFLNSLGMHSIKML